MTHLDTKRRPRLRRQVARHGRGGPEPATPIGTEAFRAQTAVATDKVDVHILARLAATDNLPE